MQTATTLKIGDPAPDFSLKGVDDKTWRLADFAGAKALAVVFSCNHCPYVVAYEGRMIDLQKEFATRGVRFVLINSNEDQNYPEDSFENMVRRAGGKGYPFPYLRDETQDVARAYGAVRTPHLFVFAKTGTVPDLPADRREAVESGLSPVWRLAYTGKIDDNWQDPDRVKEPYLKRALEALTSGKPPPVRETDAIGCTIKWKK